MLNAKTLSVFFAAFFLVSLFFLTSPERGSANDDNLGCCINEGSCQACSQQEACAIGTALCDPGPGGSFTPGEVCITASNTCETPDQNTGCCVISVGRECSDDKQFTDCDLEGIAWFPEISCSALGPQVCPTSLGSEDRANVPALSQWALIAVAAVLGIVGFIVIRRRQTTA